MERVDSARFSRRRVLELLGAGGASGVVTALAERVGLAQTGGWLTTRSGGTLNIPRGAVVRTILKDISPDDLRNGEWEYNRFRPDGSYDMTADIKGCFQCHRPFEQIDFVFTIQEIIKFKNR